MGHHETFDIIVIGAGPAGSAAAATSLEGGLTVAQVEKCRLPRVKPCAGGLTAKSWRLLTTIPDSLYRGESNDFELNVWQDNSNLFGSASAMLRFVHRPELDEHLVEMNHRFQNFSFFEGEPVKEVSFNGLFEVRTRERTLKGRQLVGADGAGSVVNASFGLSSPRALATALEVGLPRSTFWLEVSGEDRPCFDFGAIKKGYGWVFPKDDHWSAGLYTLDRRPTGAKNILFRYLLEKGFGPEENLMASLKAHRYPVGGYRIDIPEFPVYLVGDAGGFAEAITGEGIYYALESGRMAGEVACHVQRGCKSHKAYYRALRRSILPDTFLSYQVSKWFYRNPRVWLRMFEVLSMWRPLVQGYSEGKTLTSSILAVLPCLKRSIGKVSRSVRY